MKETQKNVEDGIEEASAPDCPPLVVPPESHRANYVCQLWQNGEFCRNGQCSLKGALAPSLNICLSNTMCTVWKLCANIGCLRSIGVIWSGIKQSQNCPLGNGCYMGNASKEQIVHSLISVSNHILFISVVPDQWSWTVNQQLLAGVPRLLGCSLEVRARHPQTQNWRIFAMNGGEAHRWTRGAACQWLANCITPTISLVSKWNASSRCDSTALCLTTCNTLCSSKNRIEPIWFHSCTQYCDTCLHGHLEDGTVDATRDKTVIAGDGDCPWSGVYLMCLTGGCLSSPTNPHVLGLMCPQPCDSLGAQTWRRSVGVVMAFSRKDDTASRTS